MAPVRVLVVDDSATMRAIVTHALSRDPEIAVVGAAGDPFEAREAIKALEPDVVTLDIEMPRMDGLSFLEKIMTLRPTPVVMVSSLTGRGAEATIRALELGAVDCVAKPSGGALLTGEGFAELPAKVKAAARARVRALAPPVARPARTEQEPFVGDGRVVCIGASTGGVEALLAVLAGFPVNCPPTLIVQHMPGTFTRSFAARLDASCAATVREAEDGAPIREGHVWLAPGGSAHLRIGPGATPRCQLVAGDPVSGHRPSVDVLFGSAVRLGRGAMGVILTGMGRDGAEGLLAMRGAGATTIGQDEGTSLIYGMPRVAREIGAVETQMKLGEIGAGILTRCRPQARRTRCPQPA